MDFTLRQLITFREVMRSHSISEAARTLNRTQPAVSSMISSLEKQIGFSLFIREHARLTPTPESLFFLEEADNILRRVEQSQRTVKEVADLEHGQLRITCLPAASSFFMPSLISRFTATRPSVKISLMMRSSLVIDDLIASQKYDVGLAEKPDHRHSVHSVDFDLECLCALRNNDPLATKEIITPELLNGASLATLYESHGTYKQTISHFEIAGTKFNRQFELRTFLPALQLVETGLCYSICDMVTAYSYSLLNKDSKIVFRPFHPKVISTISLLTPAHRPQSQLAQVFCSQLINEIEKMKTTMMAAQV